MFGVLGIYNFAQDFDLNGSLFWAKTLLVQMAQAKVFVFKTVANRPTVL